MKNKNLIFFKLKLVLKMKVIISLENKNEGPLKISLLRIIVYWKLKLKL